MFHFALFRIISIQPNQIQIHCDIVKEVLTAKSDEDPHHTEYNPEWFDTQICIIVK